MVGFRKLTKYLFLTLYGHNIHRRQRQLSKFLMCYQQFASHAYCGAAGPVSKMASQQKRASCVLRFEVSRSVITVQREFRARFRKDAPCHKPVSIKHDSYLLLNLANDQLDAQIFNTFITILYVYMFRAIPCSSSGAQIVLS